MLPYTIDNHFTFGYNQKPFAKKENYFKDEFYCEYSRCQRPVNNFKQECIYTALEVFNQATALSRTPYIFLSGGLDSEVVVKAFIDAGVKFKTISFRLENNLSSHETLYINKFVQKHELDHEFYDIELDWLSSQQALDWCYQSLCIRSEMLPHMKLMKHVWENLNGFPVLGNGDLYVSKEINKSWLLADRSLPKYEWLYIEYEYIVAWFRFAIEHQILGALAFFQHNPYIVLSMIKELDIQKCVQDQFMYKLSTRSTKPLIYKKYWPDLLSRMKYNGGEQIGGITVELNRKLSKDMGSNSKWSLPITEFEKLLDANND